ncbi:MAG: hypothetical protein LBT08_04285 [Synergistaceae bacterium]|jgi:hypothetical protein|nr:hypothetical protein [Synergistaceae bacterium]
MNRRKILAAFLACFAFLAAVAGADDERLSLPEIKGWTSGELRETTLDTVSGNQGCWQERNYRTESGVNVRAILTSGAGPRFHGNISQSVDSSDGPFGSGSRYRTLSIEVGDGLPLLAALETHPLLGRSIAIKTPLGTLTMESDSFSADDEDFVSIATRLALEVMPH